jgi:hypothetical protein
MNRETVLRGVSAASFVLASILAAPFAHADTRDDAERLYQEAVKAMDAADYTEACQKLEQSQSLDPAIGTQFELAGCYERANLPVGAFELFRRVADLAHQAGKAKLEERAQARVIALAAKLAQIRIPPSALPGGAKVTIDGKEREGREFALEPGPHKLQVASPTTEVWDTTLETKPGETTEIAVGPFKVKATPKTEQPRVPFQPPETDRTSLSYGGLGVAGLGVVALGVGFGFGALAASQNSQSKTGCNAENQCNDRGFQLRTDAIATARVSTIASIVGVVLVGSGLAVFFFAPRKTTTRAAFIPLAGGGVAALQGHFD